MDDFNKVKFRNNVKKALDSVNRVLELNRNPELPEDVDHSYENKYDIADQLTNTAIIASSNILREVGITEDILKAIDKSQPTTLRFKASDNCEFIKQEIIKVPKSHHIEGGENIETSSSGGGIFAKTKKSTFSRVVKKVQESHWNVTVQWEVYVFSGANENDKKILLTERECTYKIITQNGSTPPIPKQTTHPTVDLSISWLLEQMDMSDWFCHFSINRETAKTPRRNDQVEQSCNFSKQLCDWATKCSNHFTRYIEGRILKQHNPALINPVKSNQLLESLPKEILFCPVIPLMEKVKQHKDNVTIDEGGDGDVDDDGGTKSPNEENNVDARVESSIIAEQRNNKILSFGPITKHGESAPLLVEQDMHKLLLEQVRTIDECNKETERGFPAHDKAQLISVTEAKFVMACLHLKDIMSQYQNGMDYIENMLYKQLVAAIGKEITPEDLNEFIKYHNSNFLQPAPQLFCHAIRRPDHYPDGIVSIERSKADGDEAISTFVQPIVSEEPLHVGINASTTLQLTGNKYIHGWLRHRFSDTHDSTNLCARARQFSSFILVIGTMVGPNQLEPKDAILVQNKDDVIIPLLLEELPSAKEFKDAIQSLSPEQQQFAKQFRNMQLSSSVFGICVIQIKPQFERLLGLPDDALAKEMKLTQNLTELFVEYQVPSDLLSFDGPDPTVSVKEKVANVKEHVDAVMDVIKESKEKQLEEERMRADMEYEMSGNLRRSGFLGGTSSCVSYVTSADSDLCMAACVMEESCDDDVYRSLPTALRKSAEPMDEETFNGGNNSYDNSKSNKDNNNNNDNDATKECNNYMASNTTTKSSGAATVDVTQIPKQLDARMETRAPNSALRATIIKTAESWRRTRQENLLAKPEEKTLVEDDIKKEKNKAFDLLDALSRSGSLDISCSELHVIIAVTHCFNNTVVGTVIQDNINPIEKLEMSTLLIASTIYGIPVAELIQDVESKKRLKNAFPALFSKDM